MKIFNYENNDGIKNLIVYDSNEVKEMVYPMGWVAIDRNIYEEFKTTGLKIFELENWLEENEKEYDSYGNEWLEEKEVRDITEEKIIVDTYHGYDDIDADTTEFETVWSHWDGNNWIYQPLEEEITEDFPGIKEIHSEYGEYEEGCWKELGTARYDIYKDDNNKYYLVYSSFYTGSLDFLEEITKEELIKRFGDISEKLA